MIATELLEQLRPWVVVVLFCSAVILSVGVGSLVAHAVGSLVAWCRSWDRKPLDPDPFWDDRSAVEGGDDGR